MFPDVDLVRKLQRELDQIIQIGVRNIVELVRNQEMTDAGELDSENDFTIKTRKQQKKGPLGLALFDDPITEQKKEIAAKKVRISLPAYPNIGISGK